jgi:hypothetical protein
MVTRVPVPEPQDMNGLTVYEAGPIKHLKYEPASPHIAWQDYTEHLSQNDVNRLLLYVETFRALSTVPGDIVEVGVFRGSNLKLLGLAYDVVEPHSRRNVIGFDTFTGFPRDQIKTPREQNASTLYDPPSGEQDHLQATLAKMTNLMRPVKLISGDVMETLPAFYEQWPNRIAFAYLDLDLFDPSRRALALLANKLAVRGRIFLDQYSRDGWSETAAVDEFLKSTGDAFQFVALSQTWSPTAYLVKRHDLSEG